MIADFSKNKKLINLEWTRVWFTGATKENGDAETGGWKAALTGRQECLPHKRGKFTDFDRILPATDTNYP